MEPLQNSATQRPRSSPVSLSSALFLTIMTLGYAVYAVDRLVLSAVLSPMSSSLHFSSAEIGLIGSAQYIGVLCVVFLAGYLSDRLGRWRIMMIGIAIFTAFTWVIGLSSSFTEAFLFRLVSGLGEGLFWPSAMAWVASYYEKNKGLSLGIFYVGFDAGGAAGLSIGGISYYLTQDWRAAFFIAPLLGLIVMGGAYAFKGRFKALRQEIGVRIGRESFALLRNKQILLLAVFAFLATWGSVWQAVFLPYYFTKALGYGVAFAALISTVVTISGAAGKVSLGWVSDRWGRRNRLLAVTSFLVVVSYGLFFSTSASSFLILLCASVCMGFFSAAIFPVMQSVMADSSPEDRLGTGLGISTSAQSVATVLSPIIAASLFTLGVGKAIALDATIPMLISIPLALALRDRKN